MMSRTPFKSPGTPATPKSTHKDGTVKKKFGDTQRAWRKKNTSVQLDASSFKRSIRTNPHINRDHSDVQQVLNMTDRNLSAFFGDGDDDAVGAGKTVGFGMFKNLIRCELIINQNR